MDNVERYKVNSSLGFRPESAPTVLDMSPDGSLSGPPSVRTSDLGDMHRGQFVRKKSLNVPLPGPLFCCKTNTSNQVKCSLAKNIFNIFY
jgi:hypothetical protein